jgi:hypothetical protein
VGYRGGRCEGIGWDGGFVCIQIGRLCEVKASPDESRTRSRLRKTEV